ncbi:putative ribulose-bisphosphate carboxylase [Dioscorea sansibarensis]
MRPIASDNSFCGTFRSELRPDFNQLFGFLSKTNEAALFHLLFSISELYSFRVCKPVGSLRIFFLADLPILRGGSQALLQSIPLVLKSKNGMWTDTKKNAGSGNAKESGVLPKEAGAAVAAEPSTGTWTTVWTAGRGLLLPLPADIFWRYMDWKANTLLF